MRVRRGKDGSFEIIAATGEAGALGTLPGRLHALFDRPDFQDRSLRRLFPDGYHDPERAEEYRRLLRDDLLERRREQVAVVERGLASARRTHGGLGRGLVVRIAAADFDRWLAAINDLRVALGTALDVRDDDWGRHLDPQDPRAPEFALLHWLGWLEEEMLRATGFPGPAFGPGDP